MDKKVDNLPIAAWCLTVLVCVLAVAAWLQDLNRGVADIGSYQLFPLFGLLAFSVMWAHYVMSAIRQLIGVEKQQLRIYFEVTSWLVLIFIVLHPGLLVWQLWRDGLGLPPGSVLESYLSPATRTAGTLGAVSLPAFLIYEFHRQFAGKNWWKWVQYASDLAMVVIIYHSWRLGSQVQNGWYRLVWVIYAMTFVAALSYSYYRRAISSGRDV